MTKAPWLLALPWAGVGTGAPPGPELVAPLQRELGGGEL